MRRLRLGTGDAEAILTYFTKMQNKNSSFFYVMDLDDDGRFKNVFWADARGRAAYESFGDVVSFDSTYLTNKYDMPFAPFVGVNHLGQSILFGCGLLSNENIRTLIFGYFNRGWHIVSKLVTQGRRSILAYTTMKRNVKYIACVICLSFVETNEQVQQYDKLCSYFYEIAKIAAESEEKCNHLMSCLSEIKEKMQKTDDQLIESQCPSLSPCNEEFNGMSKPCTKVLSPLPVRAKGHPPSKRKESKIDQLVRKKKVEFFKSYIQVAMEGERF
ncbi:hypothetical protein ACSBR1_013411 [Camellia fascicularis]